MRAFVVFALLWSCANPKVQVTLSADYFRRDISTPEDRPIKFIDPLLLPFAQSFIEEAKRNKVALVFESILELTNMKFAKGPLNAENKEVVAVCRHFKEASKNPLTQATSFNLWSEISVDQDFYVQARTEKKDELLEEIIFHELYHCFLRKGHLPPSEDGIMSPILSYQKARTPEQWAGRIKAMFSPAFLAKTPDIEFN